MSTCDLESQLLSYCGPGRKRSPLPPALLRLLVAGSKAVEAVFFLEAVFSSFSSPEDRAAYCALAGCCTTAWPSTGSNRGMGHIWVNQPSKPPSLLISPAAGIAVVPDTTR